MSRAVSIIVPTYNERDNILPLVQRIDQAIGPEDYELLFVDDDSQDGTAEIAETLSRQYPIKVIVRRNQRGLASAVVAGIAEASGEIIGVIDADLQHPPELLPTLIDAIGNGADIAVASRYVNGGRCEGWSKSRRIISRGAIVLAHLLLPKTRRFSDPMAGFFTFRRRVLDGAELQPTGYKILLEILMEGSFGKLAEIPYTFRLRGSGRSKLNLREQVDYLRHLFQLMRRTGELRRFLIFCLVGGSGIVVNMGLLWLLTELAGFPYLLSAAVGIECSIISNFVLNDFITFRDRRTSTGKPFLTRLLQFNLVSLAGIALNMAVLWLLTELVGLYYLLSNLCGIALAALWNYFVNSWWTWKHQDEHCAE